MKSCALTYFSVFRGNSLNFKPFFPMKGTGHRGKYERNYGHSYTEKVSLFLRTYLNFR